MTRDYWDRRSQYEYYKIVCKWLMELQPGGAIVDVGGWHTPIALTGAFDQRLVINKKEVPEAEKWEGINYTTSDFMDWEPPRQRFTVATCLQTIEHIQDDRVEAFTQKLFGIADTVIISVPHCWKKGTCDSHYQDPINIAKLKSWTHREPVERHITKNKRLVAKY